MSDSHGWFAASAAPSTAYDVALLDLDGVVYVGPSAVPHAISSLAQAQRSGMALAYVTNNASRTPVEVARHLRELGAPARDCDVVTSAQAGARVLARMVPAGAHVLVVGGPGLDWALTERGLVPVRSLDLDPVAVVQGFGSGITWDDLAQASIALARGIPWVATNMDHTIPIPQGRAPGNGAFVELLALTTGRRPDAVAGKPEAALMHESILRTHAKRPIIVGDRLDTDIEAGPRAGVPTLLVLTGVTGAAELLSAPEHRRPDLLGVDLRSLLEEHPEAVLVDGVARCEAAAAQVVHGDLRVTGPSSNPREVAALWRCAAVLAWSQECDQLTAIGVLDGAIRALG